MAEWYQDTKNAEKFPDGLKLDQGEYIVEILGKPKEIQVPKFGEADKMVTKLVFPVKHNETTYGWFVSKTYMTDADGNPSESLYAQLVKLAEQNNGLTGAVLKVTAKGKGVKKRYTVVLK